MWAPDDRTTRHGLKFSVCLVDNVSMERYRGKKAETQFETLGAPKAGSAQGSVLRPVTQVEAPGSKFVKIECPYPLVTAGLARALEGIAPRNRQGFLQTSAPRLVLLWAESVDELPESIRRARETDPDATIVVLGLRGELSLAWAALRAGASGFVHAEMQPEQVARAILMATRGEPAFPRGLIKYLANEASEEASAEHAALRPRQREILELVVEGLSNAEIAKRLYLSESTIKQHLRSAYKILGVVNRTEAAKHIRDTGGHASRP